MNRKLKRAAFFIKSSLVYALHE